MPTVQSLKKKLQVIRSTRKLTQAMKTASTVKYSRLSGLFSAYSAYETECRRLYSAYADSFNALFSASSDTGRECYIVITSNKGMCGSFNTELLDFFLETVMDKDSYVLLSVGKKGNEFFEKKGIETKKSYVFSDVPTYEQAKELSDDLLSLIGDGEISSVKIICPEYCNMIKQTPVCRELFNTGGTQAQAGEELFVPDRETVIRGCADKIFTAMIYKNILETALGAQAATLTTMRAAFDTASEYCCELEGEINRKRQSQVTADVIEVSAEFSTKWEG